MRLRQAIEQLHRQPAQPLLGVSQPEVVVRCIVHRKSGQKIPAVEGHCTFQFRDAAAAQPFLGVLCEGLYIAARQFWNQVDSLALGDDVGAEVLAQGGQRLAQIAPGRRVVQVAPQQHSQRCARMRLAGGCQIIEQGQVFGEQFAGGRATINKHFRRAKQVELEHTRTVRKILHEKSTFCARCCCHNESTSRSGHGEGTAASGGGALHQLSERSEL